MRSYERERDRGVLPSLYLAGRFTRTHSLAGPESELWQELETRPSFLQEFGNAYTRSLSLERLFSFPRLARWSAKSMIRAREDRAGVLRFSAAELKLKFGFLRDVTELALRGRARAATSRRWRDGWSDAVALSPRTAVMRNAPRTTGYHGRGASRPVPAVNEAVGLLTAAGDNHDNLASLETR
jgi:hypothetical protein